MNKKVKILLFCALTVLNCTTKLSAQYYTNGQAPASQKWGQIGADSLRVVFPLEFEQNARSTLFYMDTIRPWVSYGFRHSPLKTPVVIDTENFYSNGLGMLAPKRIEIGGLPAIDTYANPWLKQLATHEYRHMVQYSNVYQSTVKVLGYIFGQQVPLLCTGVLPFWLLEGDAVMTETQFTEFGRGLQPSFTMHYRAMGSELTKRRNPDKWFAGSYKDYVPSHYELGYQLVAHSERKYDQYIWDDVAEYGSKFPFLLFTTQISLKKYYDTSTKKLYHETFNYLNEFWDSLPQRENSSTVTGHEDKRYTSNQYPLFVDDSTLLVVKSDYDRAQRFVLINLNDNSEQRLCYTGHVSTRPMLKDSLVVWTEYRQTNWERKTNSKVCYMKVGEWKPRTMPGMESALFPTLLHDQTLAYIDYDYSGYYTLRDGDGGEYNFPFGTSVHGLAFDDSSDTFFAIILDDDGMYIGALPRGKYDTPPTQITAPSKTTISDLRAANGKLYFGSIYSGYDEAHSIDISTGIETRLTTSKYGSFSPAPSPDGNHIALTTYDQKGYRVATQANTPLETIYPSKLPVNSVNPPIADWGLPKIDDITFTETDLKSSEDNKPMKRYRKGANLFNFHSWAPFNFDGYDFVQNFDFNNISLGVSAISENILSSAITSVGYGYILDGGHSLVRANFKYLGWLPKIEIDAQWSNKGQVNLTGVNTPLGKNYVTASALVYMPLLIKSGYHTSWITPQIQYRYRNSVWTTPELIVNNSKHKTGEHLLYGSITYSTNVRRARLDLIPRWGALLRATIASEPSKNRITQNTAALYARFYTPGIVRHHGLSLAASYQKSFGQGYIPYGVLNILPRGHNNFAPQQMVVASANYYLPIAYPDWGWSGVFFLKRISLTLGGDFARYETADNYFYPQNYSWKNIYSFGATANLDVSFFRLPAQGSTTIKVGVYFPSTNLKKPVFTGGVSIPL